MSAAYKPSAARTKLGFDEFYVEHERSRWRGTPYWLAATPDAIPAAVRKNVKRWEGKASKLAQCVRPVALAVTEGRAFRVAVGEPAAAYYGGFARPIRVERNSTAAFDETMFGVAVSAYFFDWVQKVIPKPGEWWLTFPHGTMVNRYGRTTQAIILGIRLPGRNAVLDVYGVKR